MQNPPAKLGDVATQHQVAARRCGKVWDSKLADRHRVHHGCDCFETHWFAGCQCGNWRQVHGLGDGLG